MSMQEKSEIRDGMRIDWDLPIAMDDGAVMRADLFRPIADGRYPVILTYGPYAKGLSFQDGYPSAWKSLSTQHPDAIAGSSNKYQCWELVDPEKWVPDGYACLRVDSRGAGRSPGFLDPWCPRETRDFYLCIEWAGKQPWSNGKVGLNGISYYAINAWHVAALQPPHLAAFCAWEGAADFYRDMTHHGGILSTFMANWYDMQVKTVQHGVGVRGARSKLTGELACGPETLSDAELAKNRADFGADIFAHPLDDGYHRARSPDWDRVTAPFLSAASWGGQGLHPRGNYEGYMRAASRQKWLEVHGLEHWTHFYTPYGVALQKRFFGHFLKGEDTGWARQPPVQLLVRHPGEKFVERHEHEWPLARTQWTKLYLDPASRTLARETPRAAGTVTYAGLGDGVTFLTPPLAEETEICGPSAARLFISSTTTDADLFLVLRILDPDGREVVFSGTVDPHTPVGQGWLRASHRKLDPRLSRPYRPYHSHDERQPLKPGEIVALDIEIWPTGIVVPKGYRIALTVRGKDYEWDGPGVRLSNFKNELRGCGPFLHNDPRDRPAEIFGGDVTIHCGPGHDSHVLLPIIPRKGAYR
jgi:predicted acyl esterase